MTAVRFSWQAVLALVLTLAATATPALISAGAEPDAAGLGALGSTRGLILAVPAGAAVLSFLRMPRLAEALLVFLAAHLTLLLFGTKARRQAGCLLFVLARDGCLVALCCDPVRDPGLSACGDASGSYPWLRGVDPDHMEAVTRGAAFLHPAAAAERDRGEDRARCGAGGDVNRHLQGVLVGYALGCGAGFAAAVLADRYLFLRRGLLPIGNMVSALPIIGIAPIMVIWFGFDWPSKAAVVVIMTFFPMLVNTVTGLAASGHMERDLLSTYAAGYWQTLLKLRLPAAGPFIFNALKINSTLAMIGAIVAEFFGTPVVGMGFRISTEVGRMNIDMVWAEIAIAALAGSVFYGVVALLERAVTFWHPSVRGGQA